MTILSGCVSGTRSGSQHRGRIGVGIGFGGFLRPDPTRPYYLYLLNLLSHLILSLILSIPIPKRSISNARGIDERGMGC